MVETVYIAVCCLLLPFFQWRQEREGRAYPFIGLSALYGIWLLISGCALPFDSITIATLAIALWLSASLIWTQHPHSINELFTWLSYLMLFSASRLLSIELALWCVLPVSIIFASSQLYRQLFKKPNPFYMFNNPSHNSAFMLSGMAAGIWLSYLTGSLVLAFLTILIITAILTTRSKGAILAMFVSLLFMGVLLGNVFILLFLIILFGTGLWLFANYGRIWRIEDSFGERILLFATAFLMIKDSPFFGHGLQMFRKLMPSIVVRLLRYEWFKKRLGGNRSENIVYANKVHNDHLETIIETGLIGYGLFVFLFAQITFDVFSGGFFIMAMVCGMVFFYFRVVHTAIPFWVVIGATAGAGNSMGSTMVLKAVGIAALIAIMLHTLKKFAGLAYFTAAAVNPNLNSKLVLAQKAIDCDPDNGDFLNFYAYHGFQVRPVESIYYTYRGLINYDGNRQIWGLWDMLARLWFNMDKLKPAEWANKIGLRFYPGHPQGRVMTNQIETMKLILSGETEKAQEKIKEMKKG